MKLPEVVIFKENKEVRKHALDQEKKENFLSFFLTFLFSFINSNSHL